MTTASMTSTEITLRVANALGEKEVSVLLAETLEEEKQTDISLTKVTQEGLMAAAMSGGNEGGEEGGAKRGAPKARQVA